MDLLEIQADDGGRKMSDPSHYSLSQLCRAQCRWQLGDDAVFSALKMCISYSETAVARNERIHIRLDGTGKFIHSYEVVEYKGRRSNTHHEPCYSVPHALYGAIFQAIVLFVVARARNGIGRDGGDRRRRVLS